MDVRVLGPIEVWSGTTQLDIGSRRERGLLALLAISAGEVVTSDRLVEELWGESAPDRAVRSLYTHVSHLRRALGKDGLVRRGNGYVLVLESGELDADRFSDALTDARRLLASDPVAAVHRVDAALGDFKHANWTVTGQIVGDDGHETQWRNREAGVINQRRDHYVETESENLMFYGDDGGKYRVRIAVQIVEVGGEAKVFRTLDEGVCVRQPAG